MVRPKQDVTDSDAIRSARKYVRHQVALSISGPYGPWSNVVARNESAQDVHNVDRSWRGYPQNLFGNWTPGQADEMLKKCSNNQPSTIYWMDVFDDGKFTTPDMGGNGHTSTVTGTNEGGDEFWNMLEGEVTKRENIRVRSLFVDKLTPSVMKILGTGYNIEPFFFASSFDWNPHDTRKHLLMEMEIVSPKFLSWGAHRMYPTDITITLPLVRARSSPSPTQSSTSPTPLNPTPSQNAYNHTNSGAPNSMCINDIFFIDLLAIHMIRGVNTSAIISYHHPESMTSAEYFHSLMLVAGECLLEGYIFQIQRPDVPLPRDVMESKVPEESDTELTRALHDVQSHLLQCESLLHAFHVSVSFLEKTPHPIMEPEEQRKISNELMKTVCGNLLVEINRITKRREMLGDRTKNALNLVFANVNIRDSASMRLISYLTMIFLPASFMASIFGMNVKEISGSASFRTLAHYIEATIVLTLLTVYIVITLRTYSSFHVRGAGLLQRAAWPFMFLRKLQERAMQAGAKKARAKTVNDKV